MGYLREEEELWRRDFFARFKELMAAGNTKPAAIRIMAEERATEEERQSAGAMMEKRIWVDDMIKRCRRAERLQRKHEEKLLRDTAGNSNWRDTGGDNPVVFRPL